MTSEWDMDKAAERTVWLAARPDGGFMAVNWKGETVAVNKHKNTLRHIVKQMAHNPDNNIWAIADIVRPERRQPHRKPRNRRIT